MGTGIIRFGGMAVFLKLALGTLTVVAMFVWPGSTGASLGMLAGVVGAILGAVTLWALACYMSALDYDEAHGVILLTILFTLVYVGLAIATVLGSGVPKVTASGQVTIKASAGIQIANGIVSLVLFVLGFKLGKRIMAFSAEYDRPRIWLFVGLSLMSAYTLYFTFLFFAFFGLILLSGPTLLAALGFFAVASLLWLAADILIGVGLVQGADRLDATEEGEYAY